MKKDKIVQRLLEYEHITVDEAVILLQETKETVTVPYHIENRQDSIWYSTVS